MVGRLQSTAEALRGVVIVDLDGTLLTVNSMHLFMRRLPGLLMRSRAIGATVSSLWWITLRSLRAVSHRTMKWHLTKIARRHLDESDWDELAKLLAERINPAVRDYIDSMRGHGTLTYIATAAAEEYVLPLYLLLGYEGVLATTFTDDASDYRECNRQAKLEAIERLLTEENLRLESFLTDHADDLPTARAFPRQTILVGASKKTADEFRKAGITRYIS